VCPAMDLEMWKHPSTRANLAALRARGATIVGPEAGPLASGLEGLGRLARLESIGKAIERALERRASLEGVRVLIGAGRTEEPLDPVRVLTNRSSGKMGVALAEAARDRGAEVTLVAGPMSAPTPHGVTLVSVTTAEEMRAAMESRAASASLIVMAAAVADFRPARTRAGKIKRGAGAVTLALEPTPDIVAGLGARRRKGQVLVGFALETSNGLARARGKLAEKRLDLVVLNHPKDGLGGDTNRVTLVEASRRKALPTLAKREVAEAVLDRALELRAAARPAAPRARGRKA